MSLPDIILPPDSLELPVAGAPSIAGLRFRRFRDAADYASLADLVTARSLADGLDYAPDAAGLRLEYEHSPGFDPARDFILAEIDERLVGFGSGERQVRDGIAVYSTTGGVHPDWRGRGIGRAILRYMEAHLRTLAEGRHDPGGRQLGTWVADNERGALALFESEGFRPVRYGFSMRRPIHAAIPDAGLPAGVELREVTPDRHRAIFDADDEAFRDHWGHHESTEDDFRRLFAYPDLDTSLWSVAWDGNEVVGSVQTLIWREENAKLGVRRAWMEHVSVRRPWRRHGVARALIADNLRRLRAAGVEEAMLGVDSENTSGALRLYESLGFTVGRRHTCFRKDW